MPYQINSSKLFLTYPQCNVPKEDVLELLTSLFKPVYYIIAHELHANGDDHIHCYLELDTSFRTRSANFADLVYQGRTYHGNYQGCRSTKNVIKYCTKAEDYLSNMDISNIGKSSRADDFRRLIDGSISISDLIIEKPQYLMDCQKLVNSLNCFKRIKNDTRSPLPSFIPNPWNLLLSSVISGKKRHFWLYSDKPNLGKTYHFAKPLTQSYTGHLQSGEAPYWNIKGCETFIIWDEYNIAYEKYTTLNSMCDGTYSYRIFQGGCVLVVDPLIIILSNKSISDLYPYRNDLLYERFNEYKLD